MTLLAKPSGSSAQSASNSAIVPVGKLENDFYEWNQRHARVLAIKDRIDPEIVLIGDSITHLWGGEPDEPAGNRGAASWKELFGHHRVLNLGFGFDRTQNVLYRIEQGELDGLKPKLVVLLIGTNNIPETSNARANTPDEIAGAIALILDRIRARCPEAKIVLMGIFPRGETADDPLRAKVRAINEKIAPLGNRPGTAYLDIYEKFLEPDGSLSREVMGDFVHPTAKGYEIWAEALKAGIKVLAAKETLPPKL